MCASSVRRRRVETNKVQTSIYRGFPIFARWSELKSTAVGQRRFTASYAIRLAGPQAALWHDLAVGLVFTSFRTASSYALMKAQSEIDGEAHPPQARTL